MEIFFCLSENHECHIVQAKEKNHLDFDQHSLEGIMICGCVSGYGIMGKKKYDSIIPAEKYMETCGFRVHYTAVHTHLK